MPRPRKLSASARPRPGSPGRAPKNNSPRSAAMSPKGRRARGFDATCQGRGLGRGDRPCSSPFAGGGHSERIHRPAPIDGPIRPGHFSYNPRSLPKSRFGRGRRSLAATFTECAPWWLAASSSKFSHARLHLAERPTPLSILAMLGPIGFPGGAAGAPVCCTSSARPRLSPGHRGSAVQHLADGRVAAPGAEAPADTDRRDLAPVEKSSPAAQNPLTEACSGGQLVP